MKRHGRSSHLPSPIAVPLPRQPVDKSAVRISVRPRTGGGRKGGEGAYKGATPTKRSGQRKTCSRGDYVCAQVGGLRGASFIRIVHFLSSFERLSSFALVSSDSLHHGRAAVRRNVILDRVHLRKKHGMALTRSRRAPSLPAPRTLDRTCGAGTSPGSNHTTTEHAANKSDHKHV